MTFRWCRFTTLVTPASVASLALLCHLVRITPDPDVGLAGNWSAESISLRSTNGNPARLCHCSDDLADRRRGWQYDNASVDPAVRSRSGHRCRNRAYVRGYCQNRVRASLRSTPPGELPHLALTSGGRSSRCSARRSRDGPAEAGRL